MPAPTPDSLPNGIVTFVFTDIEDSTRMTRLMQQTAGAGRYEKELRDPCRWRLWQTLTQEHGGFEVLQLGDGSMYVFQSAYYAVQAVVEFQRSLQNNPITFQMNDETFTIKARVGVHTSRVECVPVAMDDFRVKYSRADTNFAARIGSLGAGGQIIISEETCRRANNLAGYILHAWPNRFIKDFEDTPHTIYEVLYFDAQQPLEPGMRFVSEFYAGEINRYIERPDAEERVLAKFRNIFHEDMPSRLVTIHAGGGMGKTRLAIACATKMAGMFDGGIYFVSLAFSQPTVEAVAEAIGRAMRPPMELTSPDNVFQTLQARDHKRTLLILDNYESVKSLEVARYVAKLATQTRGVYLLVTGRDIVGATDVEQVINLNNGMSEAEARDLFLSRASLKDYQLTPQDAPHLARILRLTSVEPTAGTVSAIPLAIELASAWGGSHTLKEIADGLEETALGKFSALPADTIRSDSELIGGRHYSLTRPIEWSLHELRKREGGAAAQQVFEACGLFADSFDAATVAAITGGDASKPLRALHQASLLRRESQDGGTRYYLHRFTCAYARQKLSESPEADAIRQRFVDHYVELVYMNAATQMHMNRDECRAVLDKEWRNVIEAFQVAEEMERYDEVMLLANIRIFFDLRGLWDEWEALELRVLAVARDFSSKHGDEQLLRVVP